jgi:hypothetical protein
MNEAQERIIIQRDLVHFQDGLSSRKISKILKYSKRILKNKDYQQNLTSRFSSNLLRSLKFSLNFNDLVNKQDPVEFFTLNLQD